MSAGAGVDELVVMLSATPATTPGARAENAPAILLYADAAPDGRMEHAPPQSLLVSLLRDVVAAAADA